MAKKTSTPTPPVPDEFRRQYQSKFAPIPCEPNFKRGIERLSDEVAGRLLKAVLEHAVTGSTTSPQGMDAFAFDMLLSKVDEFLEYGLENSWKRQYRAHYGARERWNREPEIPQENTLVSQSMLKDANNNINDNANVNDNDNTNTNTNRNAQARGLAGGVWGPLSGSVDEIKAILKERAKQLTGYSNGQRPRDLKELQSFCKDLGCPDSPAVLLWSEMEFHGWEIQDGEAWRPIKSWQGFVIHRIATEINEAQRNGNIQSQAGGQDWESKLRAQGYQ